MLFITEMGSPFMLGLLLVISMIWLFVKCKNLWGMRFYFMAGSIWLVLCIGLLEMIYLYKENKYQSIKSMQKKTRGIESKKRTK